MHLVDVVRKLIQYLWTFIELVGAIIILCVLAGLLLGTNSGFFIESVKLNTINFVNEVGGENLLGLALVFFCYIYLKQRLRE